MIGFLLYLLLAFAQAVYVTRFVFKERTEAVPMTFIWTLLAPAVTVALLIAVMWHVVDWLARAR